MNDKINTRLIVSASQLLQFLPMDPTYTDISETTLITRYIVPLLQPLFDNDDLNIRLDFTATELAEKCKRPPNFNGCPDCIITRFPHQTDDGINIGYGGVKKKLYGKQPLPGNWDLVRLAFFGKNAIDDDHLQGPGKASRKQERLLMRFEEGVATFLEEEMSGRVIHIERQKQNYVEMMSESGRTPIQDISVTGVVDATDENCVNGIVVDFVKEIEVISKTSKLREMCAIRANFSMLALYYVKARLDRWYGQRLGFAEAFDVIREIAVAGVVRNLPDREVAARYFRTGERINELMKATHEDFIYVPDVIDSTIIRQMQQSVWEKYLERVAGMEEMQNTVKLINVRV